MSSYEDLRSRLIHVARGLVGLGSSGPRSAKRELESQPPPWTADSVESMILGPSESASPSDEAKDSEPGDWSVLREAYWKDDKEMATFLEEEQKPPSNASSPPTRTSEMSNLSQRILSGKLRAGYSVALVSSSPGEGTSTCTVNFANHIAEARRKRVLMVDANLRSPALHELGDVPLANGLAEVLRGDAELANSVKRTSTPGLFVLTAGQLDDKTDLGKSLSKLPERVLEPARTFDVVLFDCPPVNIHVEAAGVAAACDGVIFVVESDSTRIRAAQRAKRHLDSAGCDVLGVLLNKRRYHVPQFIYDTL